MTEDKFLENFDRILRHTDELRHRLPAQINMSMSLKNEMGFDSIALMILLYEFQEQHPGLKVSELKTWVTLRDVYNSVVKA